jgi:FAD/FMN-containing dehydrogenase
MDEKKEKLAGIVGAGNVLDDSATLEAYSKDNSFSSGKKPVLVVKPENAEQVQAIVQWANETETPLVPVSSGEPRFRGDTLPNTDGAVIVDLSGMKRIRWINRRNRLAIIEPGVTYGELQPELAKEGLRLTTSLLPRTSKSVIANLLEREPTMIPRYQWSVLDPLRSLEVVWGDGVKMTTGNAENMGKLEEEWEKKNAQIVPAGPQQTDFYRLLSAAQGSMGIVTWAAVKCEILPEIHELYFVTSDKLESLTDFVYKLLYLRFGDELMVLNNRQLATVMGKGEAEIKALSAKLPEWAVLIGIAGRERLPKERVAYQKEDITEVAKQYGLELAASLPGLDTAKVLETILDVSAEPYWKTDVKGACQDIFFVTTVEKAPELVNTMKAAVEKSGYPVEEMGIYVQPIHQGASCHCEFDLPYNPNDQKEVELVKKLLEETSKELQKKGAFFSRPYGIWADMAFSQDAQTTAVMKKIKGIFDPNNIMNPGKLCF